MKRLGLQKIPTPAYGDQLRRVPDFLKQLLASRSRLMTSSCPDQSPLSAVALSPSLGKLCSLFRMADVRHATKLSNFVAQLYRATHFL